MRRHVFAGLLVVAYAPPMRAGDDWAPPTSGPMTSLTAPLTPARRLTLQPLLLTTIKRGAYDADGAIQLSTLVALVAGQLFVEAGVFDWLALGVQPQLMTAAPPSLGGRAGFGDTLVFARVPWRTAIDPPHPLASLIVQLAVPTADEGLGADAWIATVGTSTTLYVKPFIVHADLLTTAPIPDDAGRRLRPSLIWTLAVEVPVATAGDRVALLLEMTGRHQSTALDLLLWTRAGPAEQDVVLGAGIELILSDELQLLAGWQRTLYGRNVDATDTIVLTLVPLL